MNRRHDNFGYIRLKQASLHSEVVDRRPGHLDRISVEHRNFRPTLTVDPEAPTGGGVLVEGHALHLAGKSAYSSRDGAPQRPAFEGAPNRGARVHVIRPDLLSVY